MKAKLKYSILLVSLFAICSQGFAQTKTREVRNAWQGIETVTVSHRYGTLDVFPGPGNEVRLEALISVTADNSSDAQTVVNHFEVKDRKLGSDLELETSFDSKSWVTNGGTSTIKFENGDKAKGIRDIEIQYKLYIPALKTTRLANKYSDIEIHGDIKGDLHIKQYDADVTGGAVSGDLTIELKYGGAFIKSSKNAEIHLYDAELDLGPAQDVDIASKYSDFKVLSCNNIEIDSYDDKASLSEIKTNAAIQDKYSEYTIGTVGSLDLSMYDGECRIDRVNEMSGKSKYCEFKIKSAGNIDIETSYDDEYDLGAIGSFSCAESKYTDFDFDELTTSLSITSYDDNIHVTSVKDRFERLDIDCKYTDARIPLTYVAGYQLEIDAKYGTIKYPEPNANLIHKEQDDQLEVRATIGDATSPTKVFIKAYDSDIKLY